MKSGKKLRLAILDNTVPRKKAMPGYARGERDDRFSGLNNTVVDGVSFAITIIDPFPFPLNPLRNKHGLFSGIDILRAARVFLTLNKYDAILAISESSALALLWLKQIFRFNTPILIMDPALDFTWKARKRILDYVMPRAQAVLLRGDNQANLLKKLYGQDCKTEVIYHAINTDYYAPQDVDNEGYILSVGNDIGRDFKTLIEASRNIDARVIIKSNERSIAMHGLPDNVTIIKERVSSDELRAMYAKARFVVVPLFDLPHAGGVNGVLEAMAMGKASIVSRSQGINDYLIDNETAIVVDPGNVEQLSRAMRYLLDNPDHANRIGNNAREYVVNTHAVEKHNYRLAKAILTTCLSSST